MKIGPEQYRIRAGQWGSDTGDDFGSFSLMGPCGEQLLIIASPGDANEGVPWEHVSVSTRHRTPNWKEMCFVKDLFWAPEEAVMQLHPPNISTTTHTAFTSGGRTTATFRCRLR